MRQIRAGIDVDGVMANFTVGYLAALKSVTNGQECELHRTHGDPHCWYWPREYGYTKQDENAAWDLIKSDPLFWFVLPPYLETEPALSILRELYAAGNEVYFITNRMGSHPHAQTCGFLAKHGYPAPQVLVTEDKGPVAKGLRLTHFLDDKPSNCWGVVNACNPLVNGTRAITCRVFLLKRNWNDNAETRDLAEEFGVEIVSSLKEFFDVLAAEEIAHAVAR